MHITGRGEYSPTSEARHSGDQLRWIERLRQVRLEASAQGACAAFSTRKGRQRDGWKL